MKKTKLIVIFYKKLIETKTFQTIDYYANALHVSSRTIHNYLEEIEYYGKALSISVIRKQGVGIQLQGSKYERLLNILEEVGLTSYGTDSRRKEIYERLLMFDHKVSYRTLSEEYFISKNSIAKDLEDMECTLQRYDVYLEKSKNGTYISGKEQNIRSAKVAYVYDKIVTMAEQSKYVGSKEYDEIIKKYIDSKTIAIIKLAIKHIKKQLNYELNIFDYCLLMINLSITIERINSNHILSNVTKRPVITELHVMRTYPVTQTTVKVMEEQLDSSIPQIEIDYINARISSVYHEKIDFNTNDKTIKVEMIILEMIKVLENIFKTNLTQDAYLIQGLKNHFIPMLLRLENKVTVKNPYISQIKKQYPAMFSAVWLASSLIEKEYNCRMTDHEVSFLMIYFQASLEKNLLSMKIAVIVETGVSNMELIEQRIRRSLPPFDIIEMVNIIHCNREYLENFDFVISSVGNIDCDQDSIEISPFVTDEDIKKINTYYTQKLISLNTRHIGLREVTDSNFILLNQKFNSPNSLIRAVCNMLYNNHIVEENFEESLKLREKKSPTYIGRDVAIPHGDSKYVKETMIAFVTLKEPILWGNENVSIIIFLAININNTVVAKKVISNLYHLINSKEHIERIKKAKTVEELLNIIE